MRALLSLVALGACTFDRPADVTFGEAAITITEGDRQTGVVDTDLPMALKVNVTDGDFKPIENFTVEFTVRDANGELSDDAVRTDAQGNARTELKLGTRSGDQFVDVSGEGIEGNEPVFFTQTALADVAVQISAYAGDGEAATVATQLAAPLVARVEDRFGNPSPSGVAVTFAVSTGGGSLSSQNGTSGTDGTVSTRLTMGTTAGPQTVVATAPGLTQATFTVVGLAAAPVSIEYASPATLLAEALKPSEPMIVLARDMYGNPAPGATISFSNTGTAVLSSTTVTTDAAGQAIATVEAKSFGGTNSIVANNPNLTGGPLTFTATTRSVRAPAAFTAPGKQLASLAVADINRDGLPDLVAATVITTPATFRGFTVYLNTTAAGATTVTFSATQIQTNGSPSSSTRITIGDVNADAIDDVLVNISGSAEIFTNTTALGATTPTFTNGGSPTGLGSSSRAHFADVNGDQTADIVAVGSQVRVCLRTGATTFGNCTSMGSGPAADAAFVLDMNGDGKPDVTSINSSVLYTLVNTTPVAGPASFTPNTASTGGGMAVGIPQDLDGDGKPDWLLAGPDAVRWMSNTSVGTTASYVAQPDVTTSNMNNAFFLDLNGDGKLDVFGRNNSNLALRGMVNTSVGGTLSFSPPVDLPIQAPTARMLTADFNKDGRQDYVLDLDGDGVSIVLAQ